MSELYTSPSFHQISPLTRSRSDVRASASHLRRANSFGCVERSSSFTRPSYGYGGGYMARSLSRSGTTLFGRSLAASVLTKTAPFHSVGVQMSTPHFTDKYPYVRYTYGNLDTSANIRSQSDQVNAYSTGMRDLQNRRYMEGRSDRFDTLHARPNYFRRTMSLERPIAPTRAYVRYMPVDDAVNMFKKRCMTVGTLSKYWLTPATLTSRRETDLNISTSLANKGNYRYNSRYNSRPFASRLY